MPSTPDISCTAPSLQYISRMYVYLIELCSPNTYGQLHSVASDYNTSFMLTYQLTFAETAARQLAFGLRPGDFDHQQNSSMLYLNQIKWPFLLSFEIGVGAKLACDCLFLYDDMQLPLTPAGVKTGVVGHQHINFLSPLFEDTGPATRPQMCLIGAARDGTAGTANWREVQRMERLQNQRGTRLPVFSRAIRISHTSAQFLLINKLGTEKTDLT